MKKRMIQKALTILLAAMLLLSSCAPAGNETAAPTQPQPAETTAETAAKPETSPTAEESRPENTEPLPSETLPEATEPETPPAAETTPEQTSPETESVPETSPVPTPEETTAAPETTPAPTPEETTPVPETTPAEVKAPNFSEWLKDMNGSMSTRWGEGTPPANLGETGDSYINVNKGDVFWKETKGWKRLGNLEKNGYCLVRFAATAETDVPDPLIVEKESKLTQPALAFVTGRTFEGWYGERITGKWDFQEDTVQESMTLTAVYTDPVARQAAKLQMKDVNSASGVLEGVNAAVVIFIGYTDGFMPEKEQYEAIFGGDYGQEQALESLSTYYKFNSYGKVSMEYYFYYYDTGMSCKEAFDYTEDDAKAVELLYDGFREFQETYDGDLKDWDRNGDGYVDLLYFVSCEDLTKTVGNGTPYYIYGAGSTPTLSIPPDPEKPVIHTYAKVAYSDMLEEILPGRSFGGLRHLIHETGHIFGLEDYYNTKTDEGENDFDTLGMFDMQSYNMGDWNVYSRFAAGWLDPYVIDGTKESVTIKIGCSSEVADAILIPTGAGWNGTAFDEYIMVDVLAPYAAAGFDWKWLCQEPLVKQDDMRLSGGVRIYHVDSRLVRAEIVSGTAVYRAVNTYEEILGVTQEAGFRHGTWLWQRFTNSDGYEPNLPEDPRGMHMIEVVPSDGSGRFRGKDPIMYWQAFDSLLVNDLYAPGDVFSMETCADAFLNAPLMNNGSTFDYEVRVDFYDPDAHEAIVTVTKIR